MRIAHIFVHMATNTGDIYLKRATQLAFLTLFPKAKFTEVETRKIFTAKDIADLNSHDFIVIGGGGLLLRDSFPNNVSDWQWGCSIDLLKSIKVPIVVYSIGYNRFRGQEDFNRPLFDQHIGVLLKKSLFFSARNTGSCEALKNYVKDELKQKITLNFCPSLLFPQTVVDRKIGTKKIGLMLAGDRLHLRHANVGEFMGKIKSLLKEISKQADIYLVAHESRDFWYLDHLAGIPFKKVELFGKTPEETISFYSNMDVIIGDRGHCQMIPFSLGCKIISLISHNKLKWFLDDTNLNEYGIEESDSALKEKVLSLIFSSKRDLYPEKRIQALRLISKTNYKNLHTIYEKLMPTLQKS